MHTETNKTQGGLRRYSRNNIKEPLQLVYNPLHSKTVPQKKIGVSNASSQEGKRVGLGYASWIFHEEIFIYNDNNKNKANSREKDRSSCWKSILCGLQPAK